MKILKRFLCVCILLISSHTFAMSVGERRAMSAPKNLDENMPQLVHYLTANIPDQTEKAKAIAVWIASHIAYDHDTYDNGVVKRKISNAEQSAKQVLKDKIGVCSGFADLYEKMLRLAGIRSEKVHGFVIENAPNQNKAKMLAKKESVGHVWTKVHVTGRPPLYVDTTWMSRGTFNIGQWRHHNEQKRKREIRQNKRNHKSHNYEMDYFDFSYADLTRQGEYRFTNQRQLIKK